MTLGTVLLIVLILLLHSRDSAALALSAGLALHGDAVFTGR